MTPEKREAIARGLAANHSLRVIAKAVRVSHRSVANVKAELYPKGPAPITPRIITTAHFEPLYLSEARCS